MRLAPPSRLHPGRRGYNPHAANTAIRRPRFGVGGAADPAVYLTFDFGCRGGLEPFISGPRTAGSGSYPALQFSQVAQRSHPPRG
jgi:hypothetical protein